MNTDTIKKMVQKGKIQFEWSSEVYGLGKTFRKMAHYPKFLPLFFTSDHGVVLNSILDINIANGRTRTRRHLTWNPTIAEIYQDNSFFKVSGIIHPWIHYKERMHLTRNYPGKGTIFFPYHTVPAGYITHGFSDEESINYLLNLPRDFQPITVCLHIHDLKTDRPKIFAEHGFAVTSVGNMMAFDYADDFYNLISSFAFSISEDWGSQVAYLVDFGIPCQVLPRKIEIFPADPATLFLAPLQKDIAMENIQKGYDLFADLPRSVSNEQKEFVERHLGYSFKNNIKYMWFWVWTSALTVGLTWFIKVWLFHAYKFFLRKTKGVFQNLHSG